MNTQALNEWSMSLIALAVAIVWQSTLLASFVAGACWLLRRSAPAARYWCWQIVAAKLLVMPWWIVAVPLPAFWGESIQEVLPDTGSATASFDAALGSAANSMHAPLMEDIERAANDTSALLDVQAHLTWQSWLVLFWLGGVTWQVGRMLLARGRLRRIVSRATAAADPRLLAMVEQAASRLALAKCPRVVVAEAIGAPFVCGLFRPVVVLPGSMLSEVNEHHLREVLLHELGHVKRRDLWWGWLPALARMIFFFHPVAHWVAFQIRLERELVCDQLAMAFSGRGAADYAQVLVQVITRASMPPALAMNSFEGLSTFWKRRLTMLHSTSQSSPQLSRRTCLALASAAAAAGLLPTLQRAPAHAETPLDARTNGKIYVSASLRVKAEGQDEEKTRLNAIIAIDPATGEWQQVAENGMNPRLSPDRRHLVFSGSEGIAKCEADGQFPLKISYHEGRPVWSPDGKFLVATKEENVEKDGKEPRTAPSWKDETWRIDADGRNPVKLPIPDTDSVNDWSPDGEWFLTTTDRHPPFGRGYQLYLMKTDGSEERRLTEGGLNVYARFSPDGKKILYLHQTGKEGNSIWTVDIDGNNATQIVKEVGLASPDGAFWSPDGKQIAVCMFDWELDANGRKVGFAGSKDARPRIEIMDADGANRRELKLQGADFTFVGSLGDWR